MRLRVDSAEVHTLKANGRPWDGPGGPRIPAGELAQFFQLDLTGQLERLVAGGDAPNPPDVAVRVLVAGKPVLETYPVESFDPSWPDGPDTDLAPGTPLRIEVRDLDFALHDLIGETTLPLPASAPDGKWSLGPFGQVRKLVLLIG
jgi:hypothetical protein